MIQNVLHVCSEKLFYSFELRPPLFCKIIFFLVISNKYSCFLADWLSLKNSENVL